MIRILRRNRGFTLIELSIVLVIIGLVAGGVLVGRDMIEAARIRSTISEINSVKISIMTFRVKYHGLPGDLTASLATQFNFTSRSGAVGHGDGNGKFEGCSSGATVFGCETALFWSDLSNANLIAQDLTAASDGLIAIPSGSVSSYLPGTSLGSGSSLVIHNGNANSNSTLNAQALI